MMRLTQRTKVCVCVSVCAVIDNMSVLIGLNLSKQQEESNPRSSVVNCNILIILFYFFVHSASVNSTLMDDIKHDSVICTSQTAV